MAELHRILLSEFKYLFFTTKHILAIRPYIGLTYYPKIRYENQTWYFWYKELRSLIQMKNTNPMYCLRLNIT